MHFVHALEVLDTLQSSDDLSLLLIFLAALASRMTKQVTALLRLGCDVFHWYEWKSPLL